MRALHLNIQKVNMGKHLRYDCYGNTHGHPQKVIKSLGITYQHATPQSMGDQWWFWNCENIPEELPEYLEYADLNPMDMIGWGLSKENAEKIKNYEKSK